jgi:hypothetical protein
MSDALATLADDQPAYRRRPHDRGFGVSVSLSHAKVAREKPAPAPRTPHTKPKPKPRRRVAAAIVQPSIEINGRVLAAFADYDGLWEAVRARVEAMQVTREALNDMANLQEGYIGKLLGAAQGKKFGKRSLGATLGGVGCDLALIEDEIQTAKIHAINHIFAAAATLGISRAEFARLAGFKAVPQRKTMSAIDDALNRAGCKLALVEDSDATAKIMAEYDQRKLPLRTSPRLVTGPANART